MNEMKTVYGSRTRRLEFAVLPDGLDEIEQMCAASSDSFSAAQWCEAAGIALEIARRFEATLRTICDIGENRDVQIAKEASMADPGTAFPFALTSFEVEPEGYCYACLANPVTVVRDLRESGMYARYCIPCTRRLRPSLGV